jgi:peptidoglycan hydrolase CwlO-like protein
MAENKTKKYTIEIDTNAAKTVEQLNEQLKELSSHIQKVEIGSEEFNNVATAIKQVEGRLSSVNGQLKDNSATLEQNARGFADVTGAIVGGFSLASQSIGLFSQETQHYLLFKQ